MPGSTAVSVLAAWAGPSGAWSTALAEVGHAQAGAPFRTARFDDPVAAVAAGRLLLSALAPGDTESAIRIAIAHDEPERAALEADALASRAPAGSIVLSPGAVEAMGRRLPDGLALRSETLTVDGRRTTVFALRSAAEVVAHALPMPTTSLIGRDEATRRLRDLLERERLVTLTGPPGGGKTRLAIEVAWAALGTFADGAWFVPLAPVREPSLIVPAAARVLGVIEVAGTPLGELVARHLAERELLLVMDNFEHVLDAATVVAEWLAGAPRLRVIATSRAALHLSAEHEFGVPTLPVPEDPDDPAAQSSEAVRLFVDRATAVAPDFEVDDQTLPDIARLCRRLDGLPLALELAAARAKALPVAGILSRLDRSLELLTHGARDVPERHRSLHAAVSWSYGLLSPAEQAFLRRLAVFRGGWTLEAADAVAMATAELGDDPLEMTSVLLDESLIRRQAEARPEPRYDMLETLREHARIRLTEAGELEATAERHVSWCLDLAERAAPSLTGPDRIRLLDQLEREIDNFRAALRWTIDEGRVELGLRLAAALWRFWQIRAHIGEGRAVLAELLAIESIESTVDPAVRARALAAAGSLAYWQNDGAAVVPCYERSIELRRQVGDPAELASGLFDLGQALSVLEGVFDPERGRALELEGLELYRQLDDKSGVAWLNWALGCNSHFSGDSAAAVREFEPAIATFREIDAPFGLAWALTMRGLSLAAIGRGDEADASWREALPIFASAADMSGIDSVLEHLGRLALERGEPRRAIRLAAAAARVRGVSESRIVDVAYRTSSDSGAPEGTRLDRAEIEDLQNEGRSMSLSEAIAYALEQEPREADPRLRVHALGPMLVERRGSPIRRWGGDKAGSRQAQAIFAFLFDRGATGITKDEATELLWPDLSIRRGDLAFHRTLGGLRTVLGEGREGADAITYDGGRYRLAADLVAWSDTAAFEALLDGVVPAGSDGWVGSVGPVGPAGPAGPADRAASLEEARHLYRGDYFDDCPVYGDSAHVEERRADLRERFEALLIELGAHYAERGDGAAAAAAYRQALAVNPDSTAARAALGRPPGTPVESA